MDRVIAYPGQVPAVEDFLRAQKNQMVALGQLIDAVMGPGAVVASMAWNGYRHMECW